MILSFQLFLESRTDQLSEDKFLKLLDENCKNFSFDNDLLWRSKPHTSDLQLFEPKDRKQNPVAFPKYFDRIAGDESYPVKRKKSLIGGTSKVVCQKMFGDSIYMVIPYDDVELVFCPVFDLWVADDDRRKKSEKVNKKPVEDDMFIKIRYTKNFKIPHNDMILIGQRYNLSKMGGRAKSPSNWGNVELGYEFFTSSNCLLIHESKIDWLKSKLEN